MKKSTSWAALTKQKSAFILLLLIALLTLINGVFAMSELALASSRR